MMRFRKSVEAGTPDHEDPFHIGMFPEPVDGPFGSDAALAAAADAELDAADAELDAAEAEADAVFSAV